MLKSKDPLCVFDQAGLPLSVGPRHDFSFELSLLASAISVCLQCMSAACVMGIFVYTCNACEIFVLPVYNCNLCVMGIFVFLLNLCVFAVYVCNLCDGFLCVHLQCM